ncbi:hypothetical protein D3C86_1783540 [compost metagenome]
MHVEFLEQGLQVGFDRVFGNPQLPADGLVRQAVGQQQENLRLPGREGWFFAGCRYRQGFPEQHAGHRLA